MKRGKRTNIRNKLVALALALAMLVCGAIGGTLAWLTDNTNAVVNTFTVGNIDITLQEHEYDPVKDALTDKVTTTGVSNYKMVPGWTIPKDPTVTIKKGSEDCWVFIKVEESKNLDEYIAYAIDGVDQENGNWTKLENAKGILPTEAVYYCYAKDITNDRTIKILGSGSYKDAMGTDTNQDDDVTVEWSVNQVAVKPSVTKQMMDSIAGENAALPMLIFTAYAVQYKNSNNSNFTVEQAWAQVSSN